MLDQDLHVVVGTGPVGRAVIGELVGRGPRVRAVARHGVAELLPPLMQGVITGAKAAGTRVVYADNLYAYGAADGPLTEDLPAHATGPNGRVRDALAAQLMGADARGSVRAAIGRASD